MTQKDLQIFVNGTVNYFKQLTDSGAQMDVPFLKKPGETVALDITGVIGISGVKKGIIYFTASSDMLRDVVKTILGTENPDLASIVDIAGEIANTVAGNAREAFGADFMISIPLVVEGPPKNIRIPNEVPVFVIPIRWKDHRSFLVVGIQ